MKCRNVGLELVAEMSRCCSIRWACCTTRWKPSKMEWLSGLSGTQKEEQERIMKFVFKKDAKSALIGRLMLRKVISEQMDIPCSEVRLSRTERGKPFLANQSEIDYNFNVSHQGDYVVLAAEPSIAVGVDVMKTEIKGSQSVGVFFHTMRRQFTSHEWQTIRRQPSERKQLEMFLRFWCLKESYVKALGVGIGSAKKLQSIEFQINQQSMELSTEVITRDTKMFLENVECEDWCFEECKLDDDHQVAVGLARPCLNQEQRQTGIFTMLNANDLIQHSSSPTVSDHLWNEFECKREGPWER